MTQIGEDVTRQLAVGRRRDGDESLTIDRWLHRHIDAHDQDGHQMNSHSDPGKDVWHDITKEVPGLLEHPLADITSALGAPAEWAEQPAQQAVLLLGQLRELFLDFVQPARQLAEQGLELIDDWRNDQQTYEPDQQQGAKQGENDAEPASNGETAGDQISERAKVDSEQRRDKKQQEKISDAVDEEEKKDDEYGRRQYAVGLTGAETRIRISQLVPPQPRALPR